VRATHSSDSYLDRLGELFPAVATSDRTGWDTAKEDVPEQAPESLSVRLRRLTAQHVKVLSALALAAVILATWMVMRARSVSIEEPIETPTWPEPPIQASTPPPVWMVHVMGAVAHPGVVTVPQNARVMDAIQAAGGFSADADPADLNLAAVLVDGCQIVIGTSDQPKGEVHQGTGQAGSTTGLPGGSVTGSPTINLNQATEAELDTLPGVGPVTAKAILAWRDKNGGFTSVAQLQEVDGIGPKTFAQIEPYVSV